MQRIRRTTGLFVLFAITVLFLSACGGGGGDTAPDLSPAATTAAATAINTDNATLNAVVNPKGLATTAWFEHSKDPALASNVTATTTQALGAGAADINVTQSITGLDQGATYYYRVKASNSAGPKSGAIYTFTTLPLPTVTTNAVTSKTTTGAVLNADVNPNGRTTTARFEYGKTTALGTFTDNQSVGSGTTIVQVAATLSGLDVATKYYYRIEATSSAGTSRGTILDFTTAGGVPTVATNSATSVTATGGVINGIVNPNALATYAWFEYGTTPSLGTVIDNALRGSGTDNVSISHVFSGLGAGTTLHYRIAANNSVGSAIPGEIYTFTTLNPPPTASAGPDQTKWMRHLVTLDGSGSSDGYGGTLTYLWEKTAGSKTVTLSSSTAVSPTFTAPSVLYPSEVYTFKLTTTSSRGPTATDNVNVLVKWGYLDDFSTDTTGTYTVDNTWGSSGTFTHSSGAARVLTGSSNGLMFSKNFGLDNLSNQGVFSMNYTPVTNYGPAGGIDIRFGEDFNTCFRVSTKDHVVQKYFGGVLVDNVAFTPTVSTGVDYWIKITYSQTTTTVQAFGTTVTMTLNENSISPFMFWVETVEQDAFFDNITLEEVY